MEFSTIGEMCTVKGGKRLPKGTSLVDYKTCHPYVRISDFQNDYIDINKVKYITDDVYEKISRYIINEGDVFLSIVGTIGLVDIIQNNLDSANLTENAVKIRSWDEKILDTTFMYYYLKSPIGQHEINIRTVGSTQPKLAITRIRKIPVPLFPMSYQRQIVNTLSSLDEKIRVNNKIIANLEELSQTLFKQWFIDFEFPNTDGNPYKSSGGDFIETHIGMLPPQWEMSTMNQVGSITGGATPSKKMDEYYTTHGISWITPKDLSNNKNKYIYSGSTDISELGLNNSSAKVMPKNTVLFSSRAPIGYIAIAGKEVTTNQGFKSIVPDKGYSHFYIYFLLKEKLATIEQAAGGSTFKEISGKGLKQIEIYLPPKEITDKYHSLAKVYFEKIKTIELENKYLTKLRDTLLPKLMSGELEIPEALEV